MNQLILITKKYYLEIVSIGIFLILLPLSLKVNFLQNDDWNRTLTTLEFIKGNFSLRQETANTFYLQGILGTMFYYLTGSTKFPILTLLFSTLNFYVFGRIIKDFYNSKVLVVLCMSLLFFLNPFHIYSIWGFMAENFYLFFCLISFYFFIKFDKTNDYRALVYSNILIFAGLFIKQVILVNALAYGVYLLVSKNKRAVLYQWALTALMIGYYYFLFPRTSEMHTKDITLEKLANFRFVFSLTWANLTYITGLLLPLAIIFVTNKINFKKVIYILIPIIPLALLVGKYFKPNTIGTGEFPFIENTFTRFGFYSMNLHGTPYGFAGIFEIWKYWQIAAVTILFILVGAVIYYNKKLNSPYLYFIGGYLALMLVITEMFDRYLLPVFPIFILLFLHVFKDLRKIHVLLTSLFVLFLAFFAYQYSMDFVLLNNYLYSKSAHIVSTEKIDGSQISANRAWRKVYISEVPRLYYFSYDSLDVNEEFAQKFELVEKHKIDYFLNIHVNPYVYLYRNSGLTEHEGLRLEEKY